jgi:hypothetical protein
VNFTREPIVETIISAREGYKLSLKSSKHAQQDEYLVDAVEVVSFSGALFFRCQEKPRPFFLPIHDYEVQEVREAKLTIKSPVMEKSIKIGGGKDASKAQKNEVEEKAQHSQEDAQSNQTSEKEADAQPAQNNERQRRDKKQKFKRKRGFDEGAREAVQREVKAHDEQNKDQSAPIAMESVFSHLLKPPESLISESIQKYKKIEEEVVMSPEVTKELQVQQEVHFDAPLVKQDDPELFSEAPKAQERLEEEMVEVQEVIFSEAASEKPQE